MFTRIIAFVFMLFCTQQLMAQTDINELFQDGTAKTPDYMIGFIDAEAGQTVHKEWSVHHKYFENTLGWTFNDFCNAFIKHNPQFSNLFTEESGENNPGFRKLPAGERWYIPVPFSVASLDEMNIRDGEAVIGEVVNNSYFVGAKMPAGIAQARLLQQAYAIDSNSFLSKTDHILSSHNTGFSIVKDVDETTVVSEAPKSAPVEHVDESFPLAVQNNVQELMTDTPQLVSAVSQWQLFIAGVFVTVVLILFGYLMGKDWSKSTGPPNRNSVSIKKYMEVIATNVNLRDQLEQAAQKQKEMGETLRQQAEELRRRAPLKVV